MGLDFNYVKASRMAWSFLKKYPFTEQESPFDTQAAALKTFFSCEQKCHETNARLRGTPSGELPRFIHRARFLITSLLGELRPQLCSILQMGRHGKGSTTSNTGGRVTNYYKFADFPYTCTTSAAGYALYAISSDPLWMQILEDSGRRKSVPLNVWPKGPMTKAQSEMQLFSDCVDIVESDRVTFVDKTAKTKRPIAVGNSLNLWLQLAVNEDIVQKLRSVGVNLTDQARNQKFAWEGSKFCLDSFGAASPNQFSTLDLASASDTIAYELVKLLLPSDWFALLCDLRHESGEVEGSLVKYEKFSAMGCGFTFSLESLIFWAVSKAAQEVEGIPVRLTDIAVYGDDIIVRRKGAALVIAALEYCGFSINDEKSFVEGPFKESCGADFYQGVNVRPIQLKRTTSELETLYYLCNRIAALSQVDSLSPGLRSLYEACYLAIPLGNRRFGPLTSSAVMTHQEYIDSMYYLRVPIETLSSMSLRPWLTKIEESELVSRKILDKDCAGSLLPICMHHRLDAETFKGRQLIRYYISLREEIGDSNWRWRDALLTDLVSFSCGPTSVTRRGFVRKVTVAYPVPNWNGNVPRHLIQRHPAYIFDMGRHASH